MIRSLVLLIISIVCLVCAENNQNINISTPLFQNEDTIKYDSPNFSGFGLTNGGTFYAAVRFHPQQSCTLKSIIFYQYQPVITGCWIYLHEEGQPTIPGQKIDSISYPLRRSSSEASLGMPGPSSWIRLNFSTQYFRAGGVDFWISIKLTHNQGQTPLGVDAGPSVSPAHSFISPDGNIWQTLPAYGQNKNFNIRAIVRYIQPGFDIGIDEILINSFSPPNVMINLLARIKNYGLSISTNIPVTCSIFSPGGVLRYANTLIIASLAPGDTVHFSFGTWTPTIIEETTIIMRLLVNDEVPANDREVLIPLPLRYFQDFETSTGEWNANPPGSGGWEWGEPTFGPNSAYSGTKCVATILDGNYTNNANWRLNSVEFIANKNNPVFRFWHWYNMEQNHDGGNIKISTNNGATWSIIQPFWGYNGVASMWSPIAGESCYTGVCTTWTEVLVRIPVVSGQRFFMRLHFGSDEGIVYPGWYVDDVTGIGFAIIPPPNNDVGIDAIIAPTAMHRVNTEMQPIARVKNFGVMNQTNFPVICSIFSAGGALRYTNTQTVASLATGETTRVNFAPWTPTIAELCTVKMRTRLTDDQVPDNDLMLRATQISLMFLAEGFNDTIFPPPGWRAVIIQGEYNWEFWSGGGIVLPYEGPGMARYQSFFASYGSMAQLISPPIYNSYPLNYALKFYMYHDPGFPGPPFGPDSVKVEYSLDDTNFFRVASFRRYEPVANWSEHTVNIGPISGTFYIAFLAFSEYGNNMHIDYVRLNPPGIAEDKINNIPLITMLHSPQPNPITNGITQISFTLVAPQRVSLKIYDASGRIVKTIVDEFKDSGVYSVIWNGKDEQNQNVVEGVYFFSLETSKQNYTQKIIFIR